MRDLQLKKWHCPIELKMVFEVKWVTKEYGRLPSKKQFFFLFFVVVARSTKDNKGDEMTSNKFKFAVSANFPRKLISVKRRKRD